MSSALITSSAMVALDGRHQGQTWNAEGGKDGTRWAGEAIGGIMKLDGGMESEIDCHWRAVPARQYPIWQKLVQLSVLPVASLKVGREAEASVEMLLVLSYHNFLF